MAKRTFLQLAHTYDPRKHYVNGWLVSEKYDGIRAFWDGGVTRGMPAAEVPWANVAKDGRLRNPSIATGLWSRYGKAIQAPDYWLDALPTIPLDGELYAGRGQWEATTSIVRRHVGGSEWESIRYMILDSPRIGFALGNGRIDEIHFKKEFINCDLWWKEHGGKEIGFQSFEQTYSWLLTNLEGSRFVELAHQERLPFQTSQIQDRLDTLINEIIENSGEGLIIKKHSSFWFPERSHNVVKYKPFNDDEGTVIGYKWGAGKLLGMMGALVVSYKGKIFELSGFTEHERTMIQISMQGAFESREPGKPITSNWYCPAFSLGSRVTFRYRELSADGIPKEARYWRKNHASS